MYDREFLELIREILQDERFAVTRHHRHHIRTNVYDHSLKVAYLCYLHKNPPIDRAQFVRAALLHDYYGYDWHDRKKGTRAHLFTHPRRALENAKRLDPSLTKTQADMILHHMFPLVPSLPRSRAAWLLCLYDKLATLHDYRHRARTRRRHH